MSCLVQCMWPDYFFSFLFYVVRSWRSPFLSSVDQFFFFFLLISSAYQVSSFPFLYWKLHLLCDLCIVIILASLVMFIFWVWPDIVFSFASCHSYFVVACVSWCALPAFSCLCELTMVCSCWDKAWTAGYTLLIVLILVLLGIFLSVEILVFK